MAVCALAAGLTGCGEASTETSEDGGGAAGESNVVFDAALEDAPCEVVTTQIVAETFSVSADQIDRAADSSDYCNYEGEIDGKILNVRSAVDVFETAADAADSFRSVTAGMSASNVSDAMGEAADQAREAGGLDTEQQAADTLVEGIASGGLQFVEVQGLADRARFGLRYGTLYLLHGNMRIDLTAYYGPEMPMPETLSPEAIMEAGEAWQAETRPVRKQQSIELAKGVLKAL